MWKKLSNKNFESKKIIDKITLDFAKSVAKEITSDYILSKFIAKINLDEYLKDDEKIWKEVHEIIKAELIISILINIEYIMEKKFIGKEVYNTLENILDPKRIINSLTQMNRKNIKYKWDPNKSFYTNLFM